MKPETQGAVMRVILLGFAVLAAMVAVEPKAVVAAEPIIIAHRGASGYRPEHTIGAYALAIEQGADYIEPDLVVSKDGHLVARHDVYLSGTTDIAKHAEFADRKRTLDGKTDWFVFDFTLAELKTLRAVQPRAERGTGYDGLDTIPTLEEIVALVRSWNSKGGSVGLHIELKRPDIFEKAHKGFEQRWLLALAAIDDLGIPLFFQCFDVDFTMRIAAKTEVPTVLLVAGKKNTAGDWYVPDVDIGSFIGKVEGFGVNKALLVTKEGKPNGLLRKVHGGGGLIHIWTIRNDQVPKQFENVEQELRMFLLMGVDGVFADFPDTAIKVRDELIAAR